MVANQGMLIGYQQYAGSGIGFSLTGSMNKLVG